jgi:hypothetical protein
MRPLAAALNRMPGRGAARARWPGQFPRRLPRLRIADPGALRGQDVVFLASFDTPGEIFGQLSVLYEIPRYA